MARDRANIRVDIWSDDDYRDLTMSAQWLYELLLTHPTLTNAGVADWRPGRLAAHARGVTAEHVLQAAAELEERFFIVTDAETEEVLVRSYLRHDGVLQKPNVSVAMTKAFAAVASTELRGVIVHELQRLAAEHPEWPAWDRPEVQMVLTRRSVDPKRDGSFNSSGNGYANGSVEGSENNPSLQLPLQLPTTSTEASLPDDGEAKLKEKRLPKSWAPIPSHFALARELGVDIAREVEAFRLHAETHDRHAARWNAAFTTWLKKARPAVPAVGGRGTPTDRAMATIALGQQQLAVGS